MFYTNGYIEMDVIDPLNMKFGSILPKQFPGLTKFKNE